jgi:cysteine-rich repeat protein
MSKPMLAPALLLLGVLSGAIPAAAQLSTPSLTNNSTADDFSGGANNSWDRQTAVVQQSSNGTVFAIRYKATVSSDSGAFGGDKTESLTSDYTISFTVTAPGAYYFDVATQLLGQIDVVYDGGLTGGNADISGVTGSQTGGTAVLSGSLNLADPGSCSIGGSSATSCHLPFNQNGTARIFGISNGSPVSHTLRFQFTASAFSAAASGHEAAMRLGIQSRDGTNGASQYPGDNSRDVNADGHFVTVTLTSLCGDGVISAPAGSSYTEQCDLAGSNGSATACCNANCTFRAAGQSCRTSAGVCDVAETCSGSSAVCPTDAFASGTTCRGSAGECDVAELCTGFGAACPADDKRVNGFPCSDDGLPCTVDACNGSSALCQHPVGNAGAICRAAAGGCDVEETCNGVNPGCPPDAVQSAATECRPSAGPCDPAETCNGSSVTCPANALAPSTTVCRPAAGGCDVPEQCTGSSAACPTDAFAPSTTVCRSAVGVCDVAETCSGVGPACPANALAQPTVVCRPSGGVCDLKEDCDGVSASCPADAKRTATTECRPGTGVCDPAETCDGVNDACPADAFEPSTTVCRAASDECDAAETCTGSSGPCPADGVAPDGTTCDDGSACSVDDQCTAGTCSGNSNLCGDATVQSTCGESCDDGNTDPNDGCSATCTLEPGLACSPTPLTTCRLPYISRKSSLQLLKRGSVKDVIKWKYLGGARTTFAEWGAPAVGTNYQLCLYDAGGLKVHATVPAAGTCGTKACWRQSGLKGWKYKDSELTPDGALQLALKEGAVGKASIMFSGRGANLNLPPDLSALVQPITVQIQQSDGTCWASVFSAPATTNSPVKFGDKAD